MAEVCEAAGVAWSVYRGISDRPDEHIVDQAVFSLSKADGSADPVALAKILTKVAKDVPAFQFRAGWVEGRVISIQEIKQLAELPSKEELISKIMFMLNAPAQRLATVINAVPRNLAVVTSEAVKANRFGGSAAAAPAAAPEPEPAQA